MKNNFWQKQLKFNQPPIISIDFTKYSLIKQEFHEITHTLKEDDYLSINEIIEMYFVKSIYCKTTYKLIVKNSVQINFSPDILPYLKVISQDIFPHYHNDCNFIDKLISR